MDYNPCTRDRVCWWMPVEHFAANDEMVSLQVGVADLKIQMIAVLFPTHFSCPRIARNQSRKFFFFSWIAGCLAMTTDIS